MYSFAFFFLIAVVQIKSDSKKGEEQQYELSQVVSDLN